MAKKKSKQKSKGSKPKDPTLTRNEGILMKKKITVMEENERKFAEETETLKDELEKVKRLAGKRNDSLEKNIKDMVQEVGTLRSKIETNKRELKDMQKKILVFLGDKATDASEDSDLQDVSDLWTVVNRLIDSLQNSLLEEKTSFNDLKLKVEVMEKTIVESQKKNSFWKSVSLATTIMAAVSVAYAAKRR